MDVSRKKNKEEKLATVNFRINRQEPHIVVRKELCESGKCPGKPCLEACPAGNYSWDDAAGTLIFNHEGCLECGTCRFICPLEAIEWNYPRGGFGVIYLWG